MDDTRKLFRISRLLLISRPKVICQLKSYFPGSEKQRAVYTINLCYKRKCQEIKLNAKQIMADKTLLDHLHRDSAYNIVYQAGFEDAMELLNE